MRFKHLQENNAAPANLPSKRILAIFLVPHQCSLNTLDTVGGTSMFISPTRRTWTPKLRRKLIPA
jgi:hypothetical protein